MRCSSQLPDGVLRWDAAARDFDWTITNCLPASLKRRFAEEPLYVDLTWAKGDNDLSLRHSRFRGAVLDLGGTAPRQRQTDMASRVR
jgi:hypothetical protein